MTTPPHHESGEDFAHRMLDSIFSPPPPNYPQNYQDSSSQMPPPNYPPNYSQNYPPHYSRRDQMLQINYEQPPQMNAPYYTSNDPNAFIPQEILQPTPPYTYASTSSVASSQYTPPMEVTPSRSVGEIQEEAVPPSTSVPPQQPAEKKARRAPEYNQQGQMV